MIRKVIHLLLIATILACPLLCRSGVCSFADECCARDYGTFNCCEEQSQYQHSHDEQSDHPATPCDRAPCDKAPCSLCQCICGGAVIDDIDDVTQQMEDTLNKAVVTSDSVDEDLYQQQSRTTLPHGGRVTPGRNLYDLHMSFLL